MSEDLRLYYLQQMGIDVWLLRNSEDFVSETTLMVIVEVVDDIDETQQRKSENLLNRMINSIGVPKQSLSIFPFKKNSSQQTIVNQIKSIRPRLILALGDAVVDWFIDQGAIFTNDRYDYNGTVVVNSHHPYHLLNNSRDKKNAYKDLLAINKLLVHPA